MINSEKLSVLLVHNFYRERGGEDENVIQIERSLKSHGHRVLAYYKESRSVFHLPVIQKLILPFQFLFSKKAERELAEILKKEKPDVAHLHNLFPLITNSIYATLKREKIPIVQSVHNYKWMCLNGLFLLNNGTVCEQCSRGNFIPGILNRCYQRSFFKSLLIAAVIFWQRSISKIFKLIDGLVCPSNFTARTLADACGVQNISTVPHSVPDLKFHAAKPAEPLYALYIGRLSEEKGVRTVLQAFQNYSGLRLKIAGRGPLENEIKKWIIEKSLTHIERLGFLDPEAKNSVIQNAVCVLFPSICYETLGISMLEAFEAGIPVVASRLGERSYIVKEGVNGALFQAGNSGDLEQILREIAGNPNQWNQMRAAARKTFEENFRDETAYFNLINAYKSALAGTR